MYRLPSTLYHYALMRMHTMSMYLLTNIIYIHIFVFVSSRYYSTCDGACAL